MSKLAVQKVAVLGSGVMGSQIAAHFANCNYQVLLYDLENYSNLALKNLLKLKPSPIFTNSKLNNITAVNYDHNLEELKSCDLIIEAVAENIDIKSKLYTKIINFINQKTILCTNTSGLSINKLAECLPNNIRTRFCGIHFFNPPRYQKLVELIPSNSTDENILNQLEKFLVRYLGKGIVRAKDTPNFIANRIGVFSMLSAMLNTQKYNLSYDLVDKLTGVLIGRPKSATYRTADVVGLDTLAHVINTMDKYCTDDPWHSYLKTPDILNYLINNKHLGQKTGAGFYKKSKQGIEVLNNNTKEHNQEYNLEYILPDSKNSMEHSLDPELKNILKEKDYLLKFTKLREYKHPQAEFLWACYRDVWLYASYHLNNIAYNVKDIDNAIKWGFGWLEGPFELWQKIGWQQVIKWLDDDINTKQALDNSVLTNWVKSDLCKNGVYKVIDNIELSYSINNKFENNISEELYNNLYQRQFDKKLYNIKNHIILENNSAKLWRYNNNLIFSFKTKLNIINNEIIELLNKSIDYISEENINFHNNLIIYQDNGDNFCAGADITGFLGCVESNNYKLMDDTLKSFQDVCLRLKHCNFPVVASAKGLVLGGGCELLMHCNHVVASNETYIGLVEASVGVVPAGGGLKEMLVRANNFSNNIDKYLQDYFTNIAMAKISTSAQDAISLGYLKNTDTLIANSNELLDIAVSVANNLEYCNFTAPINKKIIVSGSRLYANLQSILVNYLEGQFISRHDYEISLNIANILTGSGVDSDLEVDAQWVLDHERESFINLLKTEKTQARIMHMLKTGKPLRN